MPGSVIQVVGARELRKALKTAAGPGLAKQLAAANKDAAKLVVNRALPNVPVRSGRLRRTVRALGSQRAGRALAGTAAVSYASAIHWGRKRGNVGSPPGNHSGASFIKPNPFLWDAAKRYEHQIVDEYEQAIRQLVDQIGRAS